VALVAGRRRTQLLVGLIFSFLGALFCFLGYAQAIWLSATPNYPVARAIYNVRFWGISTLVLLAVALFLGVELYRSSKKIR
jgi:hypothetical protein